MAIDIPSIASHPPAHLSALALACSLALAQGAALAQGTSPEPQRLEALTLTGRAAPVLDQDEAEIGGFIAPLARTPQSVVVLGADLLTRTGTDGLSRMARLDASLADAYNAIGYLENLNIRGFELRQNANYRRNGLAYSAFVPMALESLERIEVLKGVSGLQSGVSASGGLVHFVSKRPLAQAATMIESGFDDAGGRRLHLDTTQRLAGDLGLRLNLAAEALRPKVNDARGERALAHLAARWQAGSSFLLDLEAEWQKKRQPSVPGFGLLDRDGDGLGESLPALVRRPQPGQAAISPWLNLNAQPWSLPVVSETAQLGLEARGRFDPKLQWRVALRHLANRLDDRIAFPDGCSSATVFVYPGFCADGSVDVYDYRSENERRRLRAALAELSGQHSMAAIEHLWRFGLSAQQSRLRPEDFQAYNYVGTISAYRPEPLPADPSKSSRNTRSEEKTQDAYLHVQHRLPSATELFWGLRAMRVEQASARTNGSRAVRLEQSLTTPWLGLSQSLAAWGWQGAQAYASWGVGVEVEAVPNRPSQFTNAGSVLPAAKSRQTEIGLKWQLAPRLLTTLAAFDIRKPSAEDRAVGERFERVGLAALARHRGLEWSLTGRLTPELSAQVSAAWLDAHYVRSLDPVRIGTRPTNVPRQKLAAFIEWRPATLRGWSLDTLITHESGKAIEATDRARLPALTLVDLGLSREFKFGANNARLRLAVHNLTDRVAWREVPTTYWGGVYLFPTQPRSLRLSLSADW